MLSLSASFMEQKYVAKQWPNFNRNYDKKVDFRNDPFLSQVEASGNKQKFEVQKFKAWKESNKDPALAWHFVMEGTFTKEEGGGSCVSLWQEEAPYKKIRVATHTERTYSRKGAYFMSLEYAKKYLQMARDEEGVHWAWPEEVPIFWEPGQFLQEEEQEEWTAMTTAKKWKYHDDQTTTMSASILVRGDAAEWLN